MKIWMDEYNPIPPKLKKKLLKRLKQKKEGEISECQTVDPAREQCINGATCKQQHTFVSTSRTLYVHCKVSMGFWPLKQ